MHKVKKGVLLLVICMTVLLAACGTNASKGTSSPATTKTEGKVYNVALGEVFHYHRTNSVTNITSKIALTLTNNEIVDYIREDNKDEGDFVKILLQVENVGDNNSADAVARNNFTVYDANGKEISVLGFWLNDIEDEFKGSELRPGGKNE